MLIEILKVREVGLGVDISQREFRNGIVIEFMCIGQVGSDYNVVGYYLNMILNIQCFGYEFDEMIINLKFQNLK